MFVCGVWIECGVTQGPNRLLREKGHGTAFVVARGRNKARYGQLERSVGLEALRLTRS